MNYVNFVLNNLKNLGGCKMTGKQAEQFVSGFLSARGAWVGEFKKGVNGTQPFDLIIIDQKYTICADVKHCKTNRFDFDRIEENQEQALSFIDGLGNKRVKCGVLVVYEAEIYYVSHSAIKLAQLEGKKSVTVTDLKKIRDKVEF